MAEITPFSLSVSGRAEVRLPAERALIHVVASSEGLDKAAVSDEVIVAAKHIEKMLRELSPHDETPAAKAAAPLAHWSKTSLSATSFIPPRRVEETESKPRHYRGNIKFDIRFKEFKALGGFATKMSSIPHVEVNNIEWILTEETEATYRSQLRKDAASDALTKAREYCEVLDCVNLRPVELDEDRYSAPGRARYAMASQELRSYGDEEDIRNEPGLEFTPQECRVGMELTIKFHADSNAVMKSA